eukprot:872895-Rhodomonas_salina.3
MHCSLWLCAGLGLQIRVTLSPAENRHKTDAALAVSARLLKRTDPESEREHDASDASCCASRVCARAVCAAGAAQTCCPLRLCAAQARRRRQAGHGDGGAAGGLRAPRSRRAAFLPAGARVGSAACLAACARRSLAGHARRLPRAEAI